MCVGARMSVGRQVRMRCFLAVILGVQITIKPERKGGFYYCLCVLATGENSKPKITNLYTTHQMDACYSSM